MLNLSLIVSSYQRGRLFEKSLPSIIPQLIPNDEIIVVAGGLQDSIEQVLKGVPDHIITRYFYEREVKYHGGSHAKNIALKQADNPLIVINDPEVFHISPCIEQIREHFENKENKKHFLMAASMYFGKAENEPFRESNFIGHSTAPYVGGIMREELMAVNGWDSDYILWGNDDSSLMYRLGMNGVQVIPDESMVAWHQWHPRPPEYAMGDANQSLLYDTTRGMISKNGVNEVEV